MTSVGTIVNPRKPCRGDAGRLDRQMRASSEIAKKLFEHRESAARVSPPDVHPLAIGGHGEVLGQIVPGEVGWLIDIERLRGASDVIPFPLPLRPRSKSAIPRDDSRRSEPLTPDTFATAELSPAHPNHLTSVGGPMSTRWEVVFAGPPKAREHKVDGMTTRSEDPGPR